MCGVMEQKFLQESSLGLSPSSLSLTYYSSSTWFVLRSRTPSSSLVSNPLDERKGGGGKKIIGGVAVASGWATTGPDAKLRRPSSCGSRPPSGSNKLLFFALLIIMTAFRWSAWLGCESAYYNLVSSDSHFFFFFLCLLGFLVCV